MLVGTCAFALVEHLHVDGVVVVLKLVVDVVHRRRGRRGWPLFDHLVAVLLLEAHMMWHLVARLHDRREFPMLGHLPWGASEDGSVALARST